jgi:N-acetyltransferase 10
MRQLEEMKKTGINVNEANPFELFLSAANVRWCYYNKTHRILGQTFGMVVLQDFEAMQPNILARTIETVEGGGIVVMLLNTLNLLRQLYTMSMDVHARYTQNLIRI